VGNGDVVARSDRQTVDLPQFLAGKDGQAARSAAALFPGGLTPGDAGEIAVKLEATGKVDYKVLIDLINKHFDLRPAAIIQLFDLRRPIYRQISNYGHFGRPDLDLPWEKTDKAATLKKEAKVK
jgi:hypothetical protein